MIRAKKSLEFIVHNFVSKVRLSSGFVPKIGEPRNFDDQVALTSVNEVETLTLGLSSKIWQKIMILNQIESGMRGEKKVIISKV